jgi:serine O-acetyltransferase
MFEMVRRDSARYEPLGGWHANLGFWVGLTYRFGAWAYELSSPLMRIPMVTAYRFAKLPWRIFLNVSIPPRARIGAGLCLIHPHNVVIGADVAIGEDCLIFHEVTLATGPTPGMPKIGNNVDLYVGARVLGGISIGDDCMVGANCVVTRDVPARSVVVPAPGKVLPRSMSPIARMADGGPATG